MQDQSLNFERDSIDISKIEKSVESHKSEWSPINHQQQRGRVDDDQSDADIAANACMDCPADVAVVPSISGITGKPVPVVTVTHVESCPWALRFVGVPFAIAAGEAGIVIHMRSQE